MGAFSPFLEAVGNLKSSRLTPDHRTEWESENQSARLSFNAVPLHGDANKFLEHEFDFTEAKNNFSETKNCFSKGK
jgi:hypothetical protein